MVATDDVTPNAAAAAAAAAAASRTTIDSSICLKKSIKCFNFRSLFQLRTDTTCACDTEGVAEIAGLQNEGPENEGPEFARLENNGPVYATSDGH